MNISSGCLKKDFDALHITTSGIEHCWRVIPLLMLFFIRVHTPPCFSSLRVLFSERYPGNLTGWRVSCRQRIEYPSINFVKSVSSNLLPFTDMLDCMFQVKIVKLSNVILSQLIQNLIMSRNDIFWCSLSRLLRNHTLKDTMEHASKTVQHCWFPPLC